MQLNDFYKLNGDPTTLEVCLILFKKCNLNCQFCFQDHSEIDVSKILDIPAGLERQLTSLLKSGRWDSIIYRIWGGELFSDDIDDRLFLQYQMLVEQLNDIGRRLNVKTEICFTSNLVFSSRKRVQDLLDSTNAILATSYDPLYRFKNNEQLDLWKENARFFKLSSVSITLTKQNIQQYIESPSHFANLSGQIINLEYYIYNKHYDFFRPSEDDLFRFYKHCYDLKINNIPELTAIINSLDNPNGRYCSCNNSCLYIDGQITFNCLKRSSNLPREQFFDVVPTDENYTQAQLELALSRKNCLNCKNYAFCRMSCLASILHKSYDGRECALARFYDYIRAK